MSFNANILQQKNTKKTIIDSTDSKLIDQSTAYGIIPSGDKLYSSQQIPSKSLKQQPIQTTSRWFGNQQKNDQCTASQCLTTVSETISHQSAQSCNQLLGDQPYQHFKEKHNIDKRIQWVREAISKFPSKIPVIVELKKEQMNRHKFPVLPNPKFLIPKSFNIGELMLVVKDKMRLDQRVTMVFTTGKVVLKPIDSMETLYKKYKDVDGFLYIIYMEEQTFG